MSICLVCHRRDIIEEFTFQVLDSSVAIEDVDILDKAHHEAFFSQFDWSDFAGIKDRLGSPYAGP